MRSSGQEIDPRLHKEVISSLDIHNICRPHATLLFYVVRVLDDFLFTLITHPSSEWDI